MPRPMDQSRSELVKNTLIRTLPNGQVLLCVTGKDLPVRGIKGNFIIIVEGTNGRMMFRTTPKGHVKASGGAHRTRGAPIDLRLRRDQGEIILSTVQSPVSCQASRCPTPVAAGIHWIHWRPRRAVSIAYRCKLANVSDLQRSVSPGTQAKQARILMAMSAVHAMIIP